MFLSPIQILRHLELPAKPRIGDFGAGSGEYSLTLAERLGKGATIYAFEAFTPHLDSMREEARKHHSEFYTLHSDLNEHIPVKSNLLNSALVMNTLHQLQNKERFVSELARVLEPGSPVLVVDWVGSFNNMGPPKEAIMTPGEAARLFKSGGFSVSEMLPAGTHHFAFIATGHTP